MEKSQTKKITEAAGKTSENISDTIIAVFDKLAGKQSDLKLSFQDLTLEVGMMKARLNGSVVLDIVYAKEVET